GISYSTIKQWILTGKLKTVKTPGGHHRITQASLRPFLVKDQMKTVSESRDRYRRVSGRNQLAGKVVSIRIDGLLAEVVLAVADTHASDEIRDDIQRIGINKCARESGFDRKNFIRKLTRGIAVKRNSYNRFLRWLSGYKMTASR